jgi:predicted transcriptional regulator of viral defense system
MNTQIARKPALGPREALLLERIQRSGRAVVRVRRDRELFDGFEPNALRHVLKGLADGGWLQRIERGVYAVATARGLQTRVTLALVADWLDGENYVITGFYALAHWNLTHFPASTVDVLIDRRKPNVRFGPTLFRFIYKPTGRLPTHKDVHVPGARASANIIRAEGALAEVLAGRHATDLSTARDAFTRGLRSGVLRRRRLAQAVRAAPATAVRRLGWIAEHEHDAIADVLRPLVGNDGYVALDATRDAAGAQRNSAWRVLENADLR